MKIAVVIPCFKVKMEVLGVISKMPDFVSLIICVDDACPEESGKYILANNNDPRVQVVFHDKNKGVGGATKTGYKAAIKQQADIIVKVDGDGQMDPDLIKQLIEPLINNKANYVKGNRFNSYEDIKDMPALRMIGNSILSFVNKVVSGYWSIMDPTNGFTAITLEAAKKLNFDKIADDYFFESDMLFRLNINRERIVEFPMKSQYSNHNSSLVISRVIKSFPLRYLNRFLKRIIYTYYLRDFSMGSIYLFVGLLSLTFGIVEGSYVWRRSILTGIPATSGTVMLAALPVILGVQTLLSFLQIDIYNEPKGNK